jgi:D-alanine-D-alanine ligase
VSPESLESPERLVKKIRVAVLHGGRSGEHEVSLRSAESIMAAMDRERYEIIPILIDKEGRWQRIDSDGRHSPGAISPEPGANPGIDVVFPVLHGTFGEDGTVQGLLELADLAYVGAGVLGSAVSMDKYVMKRLMAERELPIVPYYVLRRGEFPFPIPEMGATNGLGFPVFVKPANLGSSVGVSKVKTGDELCKAIRLAAEFDEKIIVERGVIGREFECSVLGNRDPIAAVPCEILPSREFYDYEDKYLLDQARTVLPADLTIEQTAEIRRLAIECYKACECEGMARVDFLMETASGNFFINEINTIPGFTSISMYPKMWEASGLPYSELIDRLIELALERHRERRATRYCR